MSSNFFNQPHQRERKDVAVEVGHLEVTEARGARRWWSVIVIVLVVAVFAEAIFAGAMLSGIDGARTAHKVTAAILVATTLATGLVAVVTLRRVAHGTRLGLTLLALAIVLFAQAAVGTLAARGANLLWLHVPLGVALFGLAVHAVTRARRLR